MRFIAIIIFSSFCFGDLIKPENAQELNYIHILFEWEQEPDAVSYNLQVSDSLNFNNLIIDIQHPTTIYIDDENFNWSSTYYWKISPIYHDESIGDWSPISFFSIKEAILINNLQVNIYDEDLIQDGLIIYGQFAPDLLMGVVDKFGNEIWNGGSPENDHEIGTLLTHVSDSGELYGKSQQSGIEFNFDGEVLWSTTDGVYIDLHEVRELSNGNYMTFIPVYQLGPIPLGWWTDFFRSLGYVADGVTHEFPWLAQIITEWDKDTGVPVWSWNSFDYFTMDDHDTYAELWWDAYVNGRFDWLHSNSFDFDEEENFIYVSVRHLSRITKIAYPSGEVIWNIGLPSEYNMGDANICTDLLFSWQHHVQILDNGDLLFFDNGNLSDILMGDSTPISRVRRIRVIDNSQCETIWEYELPENLYGAGTGSVQLLDNGNYSVYTLGGYDECSILEITPDKEVIWKATADSHNSSFYRAFKIPSIHPSAFSTILDNYQFLENDDGESLDVIELENGTVNFTITNESGYNHIYHYEFKNPNGDWFIETEGQLNISENESIEISFEGIPTDELSTNITFNIWPDSHEYAKKELEFIVFYNPILLGDINGDQLLNISDVILLIQMALNELESEEIGDMNQDGGINILDVIQLVNIIILD